MRESRGSYVIERIPTDYGRYWVKVEYDREEGWQILKLYDEPPTIWLFGFFPIDNEPLIEKEININDDAEEEIELMIAEYEQPYYQADKMRKKNWSKDINYEAALKKRDKPKTPIIIVNNDNDQKDDKRKIKVIDWEEADNVYWIGDGKYPRGQHPNSKKNLKQYQK